MIHFLLTKASRILALSINSRLSYIGPQIEGVGYWTSRGKDKVSVCNGFMPYSESGWMMLPALIGFWV